jgi:protein involved in polysaccharide export with SLBB domain
MARLSPFLFLFLVVPLTLFSQVDSTAAGGGPDEGTDPCAERLRLAVSDGDYPVTPGDIYQLTFLQAADTVTTQVVVESDYSMYLGIFGEVNGRGKTFAQLKPEVEQVVANAYPRGFPSLNMVNAGVFQVTLTGAIPRTRRVRAWGLSRLSELIEGNTGPFTSLRAVQVRSSSGRRATYDLFAAIYQGDISEDPLLRPGDTVVFRRRLTTVTVDGEVYEPGSYELLPGEGIQQLEDFFQGFTPGADTRRLVVERQEEDTVTQIPVGSLRDARDFTFSDGDRLIVPRRVAPQPVVYVEGAIDIELDVEPEDEEDSSLPVYNRTTHPLTAGDTLYSLLLDIQDQISPFADMERGYVVRQGAADPIQVDMRQVIYRESDYVTFELRPFDRIVIPVDQPFVTVSGDVVNPGRYPYNPFEDYTYYLNLAGTGSESLADLRDIVRILDRDGSELPLDTEVLPGHTINVPTREDRFVIVSGDVPDPGAYGFEPSRSFSYYVRQAGIGANAFLSVRNTVEIYDSDGELVSRDDPIQPDYTIYVPPSEEELSPEGAFVLVTGAVNDPGLYEIFGERSASYYIQQAGGVDTEVSADGAYTVRTSQGAERPADATIASGDAIEVARNGFVYNFNRYFPIITGGLTFITTIITIVTTLNQ